MAYLTHISGHAFADYFAGSRGATVACRPPSFASLT